MSGSGPMTEALAEPRPAMTGADLPGWPVGVETRLGAYLYLTCTRPGCCAQLARVHISQLGPRRRGEPPALQFTPADLLAVIEAHRPACPTPNPNPPPPVPDFYDTFPPGVFDRTEPATGQEDRLESAE